MGATPMSDISKAKASRVYRGIYVVGGAIYWTSYDYWKQFQLACIVEAVMEGARADLYSSLDWRMEVNSSDQLIWHGYCIYQITNAVNGVLMLGKERKHGLWCFTLPGNTRKCFDEHYKVEGVFAGKLFVLNKEHLFVCFIYCIKSALNKEKRLSNYNSE